MEEPHDLGEDAATAAPVSGEAPAGPAVPPPPPPAGAVDPFAVPAPETVAVPDAEAAIDDFEVPPPPKFEAAPSAPSAEPVVPPAPVEGDAADAPELRTRSTWAPNDTWTSASAHKQQPVPPTAAEKAESRAAASRAATARDEASRDFVSPAAGSTEGHSYRGWTVGIYGGLAVLFVGAITLMVFLGLSG